MAVALPVDGASSINVTIRVRPFTIQEAAQLQRNDDGPLFLGDGSMAAVPKPRAGGKGIRPVIKVMDEKCLVFDPPEEHAVQRFGRAILPQGKRSKDQTFAFDRVFDEHTTQCDVYSATTQPLLDQVLDGYNATVFAYGATGCGKTHTITGTVQSPGIIFMTMQELFERVQELRETKEVEVTLSYLEIYNETIRDLLAPPGSSGKQGLMLREDSHQAVSVAGLTSHKPQSVAEVMDMVIQGNSQRTQSPTEANATSSRSHAVLQVNLALKDRDAAVNEPVTFATLSIIDLAGSERASATKNRGERLLEGANINKSLLALGSCINALCDPRKKNHVPYRNSKLTRLLKFSLGGNCRTVMIVCVSPSSAHFDETQNTLRYANRAKNIQTKSVRNVYNVDRHVKDYLKKIDEQMVLIKELQAQLKDYEKQAFSKFKKAEAKLDGVLKDSIERVRLAFEHSASERKERIATTCRLRQTERRIAAISGWVGAFDQVCETREDEEPAPAMVTMRKTATGILAELEHSRQHHHQKLSKNNWTRAIDTALQDGLRQLESNDSFTADCAEASSLLKEVELLKNRADIEMNTVVLEAEKTAESGLMNVMLTTQFETIAIISQLTQMSDEDAMQAGREIMGKLLQACTDSVGQVIKPDGGLQITAAVAPSRSGTPRKQKSLIAPSPMKNKIRHSVAGRASLSSQPRPSLSAPSLSAVPAHVTDEVYASSSSSHEGSSPARDTTASPRRHVRKLGGMARKGVAFGAGTPKRRSPQKKRVVRWRDEGAEDGSTPGALVEFQPTPQVPAPTPSTFNNDDSVTIEPPKFSELVADGTEPGSSPLPAPPVPQSEIRKTPAGTGRFAIGALTKGNKTGSDSPTMMPPPPTFSLGANSFSSDEESSPLRELGNRAPHSSLRSVTNPSDHSDASFSAGSDVDQSLMDRESSQRIRAAMAKKKRSSMSSRHSIGGNASRQRASDRAHRRRSPTTAQFAVGSPPLDTSFSASHARRIGVARESSGHSTVLSPRTGSVVKNNGPAAARAAPGLRVRQSMIDMNTPRETPTEPNGRPHSRVSSIVPGSAGGSKPVWR
ncbi:Putative kinesin-like protein [Septoria linicola]|uniref:Kinesin-like protein n=1 Tax=Septoria linicola TaxID=215465 RepID=A0A9Q9AN22_9PEZI|nr:putative kinesin-like protein [Septoria linicola]USW49108.1 Putative kinesin-like protein [Septoria linicola]